MGRQVVITGQNHLHYDNIITVFYCKLVLHIIDAVIDTRAQKLVSHTAVRTAESVFAHDQR